MHNVVLTSRYPGTTNSDGSLDFLPFSASLTLSPGQSFAINASRTFTDTDPSGTWTCFLTYRSDDGRWHDDAHKGIFNVEAQSVVVKPTVSTSSPPQTAPTPAGQAATGAPSTSDQASPSSGTGNTPASSSTLADIHGHGTFNADLWFDLWQDPTNSYLAPAHYKINYDLEGDCLFTSLFSYNGTLQWIPLGIDAGKHSKYIDTTSEERWALGVNSPNCTWSFTATKLGA